MTNLATDLNNSCSNPTVIPANNGIVKVVETIESSTRKIINPEDSGDFQAFSINSVPEENKLRIDKSKRTPGNAFIEAESIKEASEKLSLEEFMYEYRVGETYKYTSDKGEYSVVVKSIEGEIVQLTATDKNGRKFGIRGNYKNLQKKLSNVFQEVELTDESKTRNSNVVNFQEAKKQKDAELKKQEINNKKVIVSKFFGRFQNISSAESGIIVGESINFLNKFESSLEAINSSGNSIIQIGNIVDIPGVKDLYKGVIKSKNISIYRDFILMYKLFLEKRITFLKEMEFFSQGSTKGKLETLKNYNNYSEASKKLILRYFLVHLKEKINDLKASKNEMEIAAMRKRNPHLSEYLKNPNQIQSFDDVNKIIFG